jgi:hypothetical protein
VGWLGVGEYLGKSRGWSRGALSHDLLTVAYCEGRFLLVASCKSQPCPFAEKALGVLASNAWTEVGRVRPKHWLLDWVSSRAKAIGKHVGTSDPESINTPWTDLASTTYPGWRVRAAWLGTEEIFEVDYRICQVCQSGWVNQPWTEDQFRRLGLARAGLAALRYEFPKLSWYTSSGHMVKEFWDAVGEGVAGGYRQRLECSHPPPPSEEVSLREMFSSSLRA